MSIKAKPKEISVSEQAVLALKIASSATELGFDVETDGLEWQTKKVVGYAVSDGKTSAYVPVRHTGGCNLTAPVSFETKLAKCLKGKTIIGHNTKFDCHFAYNHNIDLSNNFIADTMVNASILNERRKDFSLEGVSREYPNIPHKEPKRLYDEIHRHVPNVPDKGIMGHYHKLPGNNPIAMHYASDDAKIAVLLHREQLKAIQSDDLYKVYELESNLISVLFEMERNGILFDETELYKARKVVDDEIAKHKEKLPFEMNVRKRDDLMQYFALFDIVDWPVTILGNPSFPTTWMRGNEHGDLIAAIRTLETFQSKFLSNADKFIHNGAIHTNFNQVFAGRYGTTSGRLSCNSPNMQQIPKHNRYVGKMFRKLFKPRPGFLLVELDYNQAEPRLYAEYAREPRLIKGYNNVPPIDMHDIVSSILKLDRNTSKRMNMGILGCMGKDKLSRLTGIELAQATEHIYAWYKLFRRISNFRRNAENLAESRGFIRTILGRKRRFTSVDANYLYKAANSIIQGSCADIMKAALIQIYRYIKLNNLQDDVKMLLTIHDSLLLEIRNFGFEQRENIIADICAIMEDMRALVFRELVVPMRVDYKIGLDWAEATYGKDT
jgi:DNA polymerase I